LCAVNDAADRLWLNMGIWSAPTRVMISHAIFSVFENFINPSFEPLKLTEECTEETFQNEQWNHEY
jgi:hypothetical protein